MNFILYGILTFLALLLFVPTTGDGQLQTLPILAIAAILILCLLICGIAKRATFLVRIKRMLQNCGFRILRSSVRFVIFGSSENYSIVCEKEKVWKIVLLMRKRSYLTYHFETPRRLELYRMNRLTVKNGGQARVTVSNQTETKRVGVCRLPFEKNTEYTECFLVMDHFPNRIGDAEHREPLGNGDRRMSAFSLYDENGCYAFLNKRFFQK